MISPTERVEAMTKQDPYREVGEDIQYHSKWDDIKKLIKVIGNSLLNLLIGALALAGLGGFLGTLGYFSLMIADIPLVGHPVHLVFVYVLTGIAVALWGSITVMLLTVVGKSLRE